MSHCCIIAEAGVNHNGSTEMALELVDAAAKCGADVVKFQTFKSESLATHSAKKADYQIANQAGGKSQLDMLKALELPLAAYHDLQKRCEQQGIEFLSSPFDVASARFLVNEMGLRKLKLGSGEVTNALLLLEAAKLRVPILLSTGMSHLSEVEAALGVLAFGYIAGAADRPNRAAFERAYSSREGRAAIKANVTLLHCTTEYPAPAQSVNLRAMDTLANAFQVPVGYSDHTLGISVSIAAAGRGACVIEKHLTLDCGLPGPDHRASLDVPTFQAMVEGIRTVELALGDGIKRPHETELKNRDVARKSLVAARNVQRGEVFDQSNLTTKRPGTGVSALDYWDWLGRPASKEFDADHLIDI